MTMAAAIYAKTAVMYARYSSDLQNDRSIDDQFALCRTKANRDGYKIAREFHDRGKSGATMFERDGLLELMAAAKAKQFEAIIVESLDRLSRDQEDLAGLFKRLKFFGVKLLTVNEGETTQIHVGIRGLVGSLFLADLGDKVRRGFNGRVREGKIPGAVAYGYRTVFGKPGEREIDQEKAAVIRRIFQEYADGRSPREICVDLMKDGFIAPSGRPEWNHKYITGSRAGRGMIGNVLYIGKIEWNTFTTVRNPDTGKKSKRRTAEGEAIVVDAPHLRIVDQDLWDRANAVRRGRAIHKFGPFGKIAVRNCTPRNAYLLAGLLRCGVCGGHMTIVVQPRGQSHRVSCRTARQLGGCEHRRTFALDRLQKGVIDCMRARLTDPNALTEAAKAFHAEYVEEQKRNRTDLAAAKKQLNRVTVQIDRIVSAITDSDAPVAALTAKLGPLETERVGLTEKVRLLGAETKVVDLHPNVIETYRQNIEDLHARLSNGPLTPELRMAVHNVIDTVVVNPTRKRMPYEINVYSRLGAMLGVDLFPTARTPDQIIEEQGGLHTSISPIPLSEDGRQQSMKIVPLGRWKVA